MRAFIDRGGLIAWGIVPNNKLITQVTAQSLADKLRGGFDLISAKAGARGVAIRSAELAQQSMIAPSCGLGSTTIDIAERVIDTLAQTGEILKRG